MLQIIGIGLSVLMGILEVVGISPAAVIPGNFTIGALFNVHMRSNEKFQCEEIDEWGTQAVEAALMTVDNINLNANFLRGVTLGLEARDTCSSPAVALREAMVLARAEMRHAFEFDLHPRTKKNTFSSTASDTCEVDEKYRQSDSDLKKEQDRTVVMGVVGPTALSDTTQVHSLLKVFDLPQIGFPTKLPESNDKTEYNTMFPIGPSGDEFLKAIIDLLRHFNWTYVSVINSYGIYAQEELEFFYELASKSNICIAEKEAVDSSTPVDNREYERIITKLDESHLAKIVVCFCSGEIIRRLFSAMRKLELSDRFTFISSDEDAFSSDAVMGLNDEAWGGLSLRITSLNVPMFDVHDCALKLLTSKSMRNPWLIKYWEHKLRCTIRQSGINQTRTIYSNRIACTGNENVCFNYIQKPKLATVVDSIWQMAYGLHYMLEDICGKDYNGVCSEMNHFNKILYSEYLDKTQFLVPNKTITPEYPTRYLQPGYEIMNYKIINGHYKNSIIGTWNNNDLHIINKPEFKENKTSVTSVCSLPCPPGHFKNIKLGGQEKKCCWVCVPCREYEYLYRNESACEPCPDGFRPNSNKTGCLQIKVEYTHWDDSIAVVTIIFSVVGLIATFGTFYVFIKYNDTPMVRASTPKLSYLILVGMILMHISAYAVLAKPTCTSCVLRYLIAGIGDSMVYASIFPKTRRISKILGGPKNKLPKIKYRCLSTRALVMTAFCIILFKVVVTCIMFALYPPVAGLVYPSRDRAVLICIIERKVTYVPYAIDLILAGACTFYAIKTRNVTDNYNEAKFIGFALYIASAIWIVHCTIYFCDETKKNFMGISVSLCASVNLVFLFFPKLYIIIFKPQENSREAFELNMYRTHQIRESNELTTVLHLSQHHVSNISTNNLVTSGKPIPKNTSVQTDLESFADSSTTISHENLATRLSIDVFQSRDKLLPIFDIKNNASRKNHLLGKNTVSCENICSMVHLIYSTKLDVHRLMGTSKIKRD